MDKKEPIFTATDIVTEEKVEKKEMPVKESKAKISLKTRIKEKAKAVKTKIKNFKMTAKQKRLSIASLICLVLVLLTVWIISFFTKDASNVATIESKVEVTKEVSKTEEVKKESFWSRLFSSEEEVKEVVAPAFDIVRMEKGEAVIAGTAAPSQKVYILDNGKLLGTETADENGQWVFIPTKPLEVGSRKLSLYVMDEDGNKIKSKQSAILNVSKKVNNEVAVIMGGKKSSKVLKAPRGQEIGALRIAKIDYNEDGDFKVEGMAIKGSTVNLYMNNELVSQVKTDDYGFWAIDEDFELEDEKQVIRADMVSSKGKVLRRVEYKFTPVLFDGENGMTVIKKGDCLWNIALKEYGRGMDYVIIFEANKSQIKDPNKIYVGQVFSIIKKDSDTFEDMKEEFGK